MIIANNNNDNNGIGSGEGGRQRTNKIKKERMKGMSDRNQLTHTQN